MIDHIAIRDRLVRRYYDRPGTVTQIAAEEFPEASPEDVEAARRHVDSQVYEITIGRASCRGRELMGGKR